MRHNTVHKVPEETSLKSEMVVKTPVPAWLIDISILVCIIQFSIGWWGLSTSLDGLCELFSDSDFFRYQLSVKTLGILLAVGSIYIGCSAGWQRLWQYVTPQTCFIGMLWSGTIASVILLFSALWQNHEKVTYKPIITLVYCITGLVLCLSSIGILPVISASRKYLHRDLNPNTSALHVFTSIILVPGIAYGLLLANISGWWVVSYISMAFIVIAVTLQFFYKQTLTTLIMEKKPATEHKALPSIIIKLLFWCMVGQLFFMWYQIPARLVFDALFYDLIDYKSISSDDLLFTIVIVAALLMVIGIGFYATCVYIHRNSVYKSIMLGVIAITSAIFIVMMGDALQLLSNAPAFPREMRAFLQWSSMPIGSGILCLALGCIIAIIKMIACIDYQYSFNNYQAVAVAVVPIFVNLINITQQTFLHRSSNVLLSTLSMLITLLLGIGFYHFMLTKQPRNQ